MINRNERDLKKELIDTLENLCKKEPSYRDHINPLITLIKDKDTIIPNNDYQNVDHFLILLGDFLQEKLKAQVKAKRSRL